MRDNGLDICCLLENDSELVSGQSIAATALPVGQDKRSLFSSLYQHVAEKHGRAVALLPAYTAELDMVKNLPMFPDFIPELTSFWN